MSRTTNTGRAIAGANILCGLISGLGVLVMLGWLFDVTALKSIFPDWVTMKFATAFSFVLSGAMIYCIARTQTMLPDSCFVHPANGNWNMGANKINIGWTLFRSGACLNPTNIGWAERFAAICVFFMLLCLAGCDRAPREQGPQYADRPEEGGAPVYRLAIHPLHNPRKLIDAYQPLVDYLNWHIEGVRFELEASRDYRTYEAKFRAREPEFLLPNPWQTLEAMKVGYHVMAMAGDADDFKGIFIVRRDSGIKDPADLKGKVVSYPSPTALAACIMPQDFLQHHGIDVNHDIENRYVGSQESSIMNVYLRQSDAGATWPPPWRAFQKDHPAEAAQLKVIWETEPLMNNSVMARDDVPVALRDRVRDLLLELDHTAAGRDILTRMETARMHPADDAAYERVREYIKHFEKEVRPVEQR